MDIVNDESQTNETRHKFEKEVIQVLDIVNYESRMKETRHKCVKELQLMEIVNDEYDENTVDEQLVKILSKL